MGRGAIVVSIAVLALMSGTATSANAPPQVTVIGDSVSTVITRYDDVRAIVDQGLRVDWEVAICRRVSEVSCPFQGQRPPTLVDLVPTLAAVAPVVVVELGYNDPEAGFAAGIDAAMRSLVARGAQHVLWLTLRESRGPFPELNALLDEATARWPQLELVDWDAASADHPAWFQLDGIHLDKRGGRALAQVVQQAVTEYVQPLRIVASAAPARHTFSAQLQAVGGTPPYTWRAAAPFPRGARLLANGSIFARLAHPERLTVQVEDVYGTRASTTLVAR